MWWPFGKRDKTPAELVSQLYVQRLLEEAGFQAVRTYDKGYLLMQEKDLEEVIDGGFYGLGIPYHENSVEFPDCDDFARTCVGDIIRECARLGYSALPAFGIALLQTGERRHLMCVGVSVKDKVKFYEPQTRKWLQANELNAETTFVQADV